MFNNKKPDGHKKKKSSRKAKEKAKDKAASGATAMLGMPPKPLAQQEVPDVEPPAPVKQPTAMLFMGAPPPPPSSLTAPIRPKPVPPGSSEEPQGFWTQRGLPGFSLNIPKQKIVKDTYVPGLNLTQPASSGATISSGATTSSEVDPDDPDTWGMEKVVDALQPALLPSHLLPRTIR